MLPRADDLVELAERLARRAGRPARVERAVVEAALSEAGQLAGEAPRDEPAAMFFTFARRSRALGATAESFVLVVVRAQAIAGGHELVMDDLELRMLRAGVLRGELRFEALRAWFSDCLRPIGT